MANDYDAILISYSIPGNVEPGKSETVKVTLQNTGTRTWLPSYVSLCSTRPDNNTDWGYPSCRPLNAYVYQGQTYNFVFPVTASMSTSASKIMSWRLFNNNGGGYFGAEVVKRVSVRPLPSQFLAKVYTEVYGRAPTPAEWGDGLAYFKNNGCTLNSAENFILNAFGSTEYSSLNYDNESKVITIYRATLGRDPDPGGFAYWRDRMNSGTATVTQVLEAVFTTSEFRNFETPIFGWLPYRWQQSGQTNFTPAAPIGADASCREIFTGGDGLALQTMLNRTPAGSKICLAQKIIVPIYQSLVLPNGVTLTTVGSSNLNKQKYARFGRLIRGMTGGPRGFPLVTFNSNSTLQYVWVDGQEMVVGRVNRSDFNLNIDGVSNGVTIRECKLSDSPSATNLQITWDCSNVNVANNVITAYTSQHWINSQDTWTDGISDSGPSSIITGNHVVDATDVGIVVFGIPNKTQMSWVSGNTILNSGNSAYGGMGLDQFVRTPFEGGGPVSRDFTGTLIENNTLWTGPYAHMDVGLFVGSRLWWGKNTVSGQGSIVRQNSSGGQIINCNIGIAVGSMYSATVMNNGFYTNLMNTAAPGDGPAIDLINVLVQSNSVRPTSNIQSHTERTDDDSFDEKIFHSQ